MRRDHYQHFPLPPLEQEQPLEVLVFTILLFPPTPFSCYYFSYFYFVFLFWCTPLPPPPPPSPPPPQLCHSALPSPLALFTWLLQLKKKAKRSLLLLLLLLFYRRRRRRRYLSLPLPLPPRLPSNQEKISWAPFPPPSCLWCPLSSSSRPSRADTTQPKTSSLSFWGCARRLHSLAPSASPSLGRWRWGLLPKIVGLSTVPFVPPAGCLMHLL